MNNVCTLYLIRHGQSVSNRDGLVGGQTDHLLTDKGRQQAEATGEVLKSIHFDEVYSSDLSRAIETVEIISGHPVEAAHQLVGLRERSFGTFEGKLHVEFAKERAAQHDKVSAMSPKQRWEFDYGIGMESNDTLSNRVMESLIEIADKNMGKTVLIGMHGGPIRTTLIRLGFAADESALPPGSFNNGGYVVLTYDGQSFTIKQVVGVNKRESYSE